MHGNLVNRLLGEPLVQFLFIGILLFVADRIVFLQDDNPYDIVVGEQEIARLVEVFTEGQGRPPTKEEVGNLLVKWSQNEIFYREARIMGLDQGDEMMRSRLILKMRNVIFNRVVDQSPEEEELEKWFELNRENYDIPERYTIERLRLPDVSDEEGALAVAQELAQGPLPDARSSDLQRYFHRSADNIATLFTEIHAKALLTAPADEWISVQAAGVWNLLRVSEVHAAIPAVLEQVKTQVAKDFGQSASGMQVSEMAEEIAEKYRIRQDFDDTDLEQILISAKAYEAPAVTAQSRSLKARAGVAGANKG